MINLDRLEQIGKTKPSQPIIDDNKEKFAIVEILNINKVPLKKLSFSDENENYMCPICSKYTLKLIIDYRCVRCSSKVIRWKCYKTYTEDKHIDYERYFKDFEEAVKERMNVGKKRQ